MRIIGLCFLMALSGCGGGAGGDAGGRPTPGQIDDILDGTPVSPPATLPVSGRAHYDGYMRANLPTGVDGARAQYLADLTLDVNFGAGFDQIRGQATGFETADRSTLAGALTITNGNIYRDTDATAAYSFDGDVDGALTGPRGTYVIDASLEGEFLGQGQTAARGLVFGDITGPAGQDIFDGTFAGTRRPD